jgi:hypothetical protein
VGYVLEVWAARDVVAAYEWVASQPPSGAGELFVTVLQRYLEESPEQASQLVVELPEGQARTRLIERYTRQLAATDAATALDWLAQFGEDVPTHHARSSTFEQWAERDPWAAIDHAALNVDGEEGFELVAEVASQMGRENPGGLAGSLCRVPETHRALAAEQLAGTWTATEPARAREWIDTLPPGDLRDAAIRGAVAATMTRAPERALELANTASLPARREEMARDIRAHRQGRPTAEQ